MESTILTDQRGKLMQKKHWTKFDTHSWSKYSQLTRIEGKVLNFIKVHYKKSTANIILDAERLSTFPQRLGIRWGCPLPPFLFTMILDLSTEVRQGKERHVDLKEKIKLSLFQITWSLCVKFQEIYQNKTKHTIPPKTNKWVRFSNKWGQGTKSAYKNHCISIY